MRSARSRVGSSRIASSAQRRLTAVGREAASVSNATSTSVATLGRERHAVRGGDADRRRPAHGEHPDRLGELGRGGAAKVGLLAGKQPLVEDDDGVILEPDDPMRFELGHAWGRD